MKNDFSCIFLEKILDDIPAKSQSRPLARTVSLGYPLSIKTLLSNYNVLPPKQSLGAVRGISDMGWLRLVGSLKLQVSFAEYSLFYWALLQKRSIILRNLLIEATPYFTHTPRKQERKKKRKTKRGRVDGREEEKERWREGRGGGVRKKPRSIARATFGGGERYYNIALHTRTHRERVEGKKEKDREGEKKIEKKQREDGRNGEGGGWGGGKEKKIIS